MTFQYQVYTCGKCGATSNAQSAGWAEVNIKAIHPATTTNLYKAPEYPVYSLCPKCLKEMFDEVAGYRMKTI